MPGPGIARLEDLAFDLTAKAHALAGQLHPIVRASVGELVRSMNCYYSNLIEGHDTHPRDIDRALAQDFSAEPAKRNLQQEAVAHITVQRSIDDHRDPDVSVTSVEYLRWVHREFCSRLPEDLLWVENRETGERIRVQPGELRTRGVQVGRHIPPEPEVLARFMERFEQAYDPRYLSKIQQVVAAAAAHHRLLWIHPFIDGNGRVTRLMSHAMLGRLGIGDSLWSVARGLARQVGPYKERLMAADEPRRNDTDGRGALSLSSLTAFSEFFLRVAIDQVEYMDSVLQPSELIRRIEQYVADEAAADRLHSRSFPLLREALHSGEFERGAAETLLGTSERTARSVVAELLDRGLLVSPGPRGPLRLGFPINVVERWFPALYPSTPLPPAVIAGAANSFAAADVAIHSAREQQRRGFVAATTMSSSWHPGMMSDTKKPDKEL